MNLIPNNDNNSNSNNNNGGWGQPSNNSVSNRNWDVESNENSSSQWMLNSNHNSISNTNASNIINANNSSQVNQSDDLENASLLNECATMPKNWSQVVENNTSSTSNIETQPQTNVINVEPIKSNMIKDDKFTNIELFSNDWGTVPINQNIRWNFPCPSNYQPPPREVQSWNGLIDNSWKFSSSTTGTSIWEANIRKKAAESPTESVSSQTQNAQNWNTNSTNNLGGTWGEEENFSKMWNSPASTNGNTNTASINNNWVPENDKNQGWSKQVTNTEEKVPTVNGNTKETSDTFFSTWDSNSNSVKEKESGWNENDSVANNENIHDDGTALWNNSKRPSGNGRWKEENDANKFKNNMTNSCANGNNAHLQNNGFPATSPGVLRIPSASSVNEKNNWNKNQPAQQNNNLKNNWSENHGNWNDFNKNLNNADSNGANGGNPLWNESASPLNWNKTNNKNGSNWSENQNAENPDWMSKFKKELILQSHQFKVLYDMGFRKENIETALKNCNMNIKEATDELRANVLKENSNDIDRRKNSGFNQSSSLPLNSSINNRNTSQFNQMSQQHDPQIQQQPNQMFRNNNANNNVNKAPNTANAMLSDKRLGNLVQQIQLAVQSGHLNAQILNQPLSVNTIQLIYQLLQQIKFLQTLQLQSTPNMNKNIGSSSIQSDINVQITQVKQRISSLQNQIKVQQTIFINQQMNSQQSVPNPGLNGLTINPNNLQISNSEFKNLVSPDSTGLTNEFRDLQLNQQNQSRLSTWKNTNFDKDLQVNSNNNNSQNFSRAPGSIKGNLPVVNNNNWSGFANDPWVNEGNDYRESINVQQNSSYMNDSGIPEFQPGKPWKGTQIKNSEDDPHLTPGSVNRSILSLNNLKDPKAYYNNWSSKNNNSIGNNIQPNNLSASNTWTFNNGNMNSPSWNGFNNESSSPVESLWQGGAMPKVKGPPPGLSPNKSSKMNENNWDEANVKGKSFTSYLLLKNLTPQIDASTLRTLCMQHGPLQMFNFLNNGLALVKYKSKEEAIKAQSALNNCYLSNTTILVDLVSENEVQQYISGQQTPSNPMNWNNNSNSSNSNGVIYRNNQTNNANGSMMNGANSWQNPVSSINSESQWTFTAGNLWNSSIDHNASPMQNLLPGDLLNGESV